MRPVVLVQRQFAHIVILQSGQGLFPVFSQDDGALGDVAGDPFRHANGGMGFVVHGHIADRVQAGHGSQGGHCSGD